MAKNAKRKTPQATAPELLNEYNKVSCARELDLSHDAQARRLGRELFDDYAHYIHGSNTWLLWNGTFWCPDEIEKSRYAIRELVAAESEVLVQWVDKEAHSQKRPDWQYMAWGRGQAKQLKSKANILAVEKLLQSNPSIAITKDRFDANIMLLGTPAGTVDLSTGHLQPANKDDLISKQTACRSADPDSSPTLWLKFLDRIFDGDQEMIDFMQRAAGYALTGSTKEHKFLFLYGDGRNGKSIFLDTLRWLFGTYAYKANSNLLLATKSDQHPTGIASLEGARLVLASEIAKGATWNDSLIKELTGDDTITARKMQKDWYSFTPQLTLMIAGNHKPTLNSVGPAMQGRLLLVPFQVQIPDEEIDKDLPGKLRKEGPEILRWVIDGALKWQRQGLNPPSKIKNASRTYLKAEDRLQNFLDEAVIISAAETILTKDLYEGYCSWCKDQGVSADRRKDFKYALESKGYYEKRTAKGFEITGLTLADI